MLIVNLKVTEVKTAFSKTLESLGLPDLRHKSSPLAKQNQPNDPGPNTKTLIMSLPYLKIHILQPCNALHDCYYDLFAYITVQK